MATSKGSAQWNGGIKDGKGTMKPAHAPEAQFALGSRFEGAPGSNPEELIGAALAGCFSMALSMSLESAIRAVGETGVTQLVVTHDVPFAHAVAGRVFLLERGCMREETRILERAV